MTTSKPSLKPVPARTTLSPAVAVVGCGRWGRNLVRNFYHLDHLHSLCDMSAEQLKTVHADYSDIAATTNYQSILNNPAIHAVVISTPSFTHYPLARQALEAGKHVYVEKPIATSCEETDELYRLAALHDRVLMVGHLLLYHPAVNRLKQLIQEGCLGDIRYIQSDRLNFNPFRPDQNAMWDLAPHDLSMMCYLLDDEPEAVLSVNGHNTGDDGLMDVVHIELRFPGNIAGHIHNSWIHPHKQVKLIVRGTERIAILDDTLGEGKLQIFRKEDEHVPVREFPEYLTIEPLKLECQHFINSIRLNKKPRTDGYNGYTVVRVLEEASRMLQANPDNND